MSRINRLTALLVILFSSQVWADTPYPHIAPTEPKTPAEEKATFKVPAGFEVQLVASEPDIRKPIQMSFDAKGRLWVVTSEEYPFPAVGRKGKDRLYVLEDFAADGRAKKISIFADDLNIPIGVVPLPDCRSAIVSSIEPLKSENGPRQCWIWKLTDSDGDGKYDKKEKLYGPFGCDDTHGMNNSYTLMPDGWIYACHGFRNDSRPKGSDGQEIFMNSGNTFRFKPDGSHIEIWTHGQVNPFGVAIDPYFNLYTADCHSRPVTQLIRGATYTSFSKPDDGLGFAPNMIGHGHDSTALCGLVYYTANHFPEKYLNCLFLGNVTGNCINLDKVKFNDATPQAVLEPNFFTSNDYWCRPVDIKSGPDGALYFSDFYNKIIGHYEVDLRHPGRDKLRGRVWRIIWKGLKGEVPAPTMPRTDWTTASPEEILADLAHPNLTVRLLALQQAIHRKLKLSDGHPAVNDQVEASLIWLQLSQNRLDVSAQAFQERLGKKPAEIVEVHYIQAASRSPQYDTVASAFRSLALSTTHPLTRRALIEAMIGHPSLLNVPTLLQIRRILSPADTHTAHAVRVALRDSLRNSMHWANPREGSNWSNEEIGVLADIALAIPTETASVFLLKNLKLLSSDGNRFPAFLQHAARYAPGTTSRELLDFISDPSMTDIQRSIRLFLAYQRGRQQRGDNLFAEQKTAEYVEKLTLAGLHARDAATVQGAIELAHSWKISKAEEALIQAAVNRIFSETLRSSALAALAQIHSEKALLVLVSVLNDETSSIALRERTAQLIALFEQDSARTELIRVLQTAPARLQTAIAISLAASAAGGEKLLNAVAAGKASARLLQDRMVESRMRDSRIAKVQERIAALTKGLPSIDQRIQNLIKSRGNDYQKAKPDAQLGKAVFTKNCAICHQIGNEGAKIGPQLDGIGGRGLDRLLEDLLDPNRNVDAAFRTTVLSLKDGRQVQGLVLREEGTILVVADDKGKEIRISKNDVDERRQSLLSPMPANVSEIISEKEFQNLLAYLLTQRPTTKK